MTRLPLPSDAPAHASCFSFSRRRGVLAAVTALLSGCSGVQALDALVPDHDYQVDADIPYGDAPRQRLDVYRPLPQETGSGVKPPLVVFFYGGNWTNGERTDYRFVGEALASAGAVVVIPDYRLSPEVRYPTFLEDCAHAVRWAVDHADTYGADAKRLVLMGHSAGGYNAAMLALDPRWLGAVGLSQKQVSAWIGLAGPYDFLPIGEPMTQAAFNWPDTPADSQPIAHVTPDAPPTLLLVAEKDDTVDPQRNSVPLAAKLKAAGVDVSFRAYPRVSHATLIGSMGTPLRWLAPVRRDVLRFLGLERKAST